MRGHDAVRVRPVVEEEDRIVLAGHAGREGDRLRPDHMSTTTARSWSSRVRRKHGGERLALTERLRHDGVLIGTMTSFSG